MKTICCFWVIVGLFWVPAQALSQPSQSFDIGAHGVDVSLNVFGNRLTLSGQVYGTEDCGLLKIYLTCVNLNAEETKRFEVVIPDFYTGAVENFEQKVFVYSGAGGRWVVEDIALFCHPKPLQE